MTAMPKPRLYTPPPEEPKRKRNPLGKTHHLFLGMLYKYPKGLTDEHLSLLCNRRLDTTRRRREELVNFGLVSWTGKQAKTTSGCKAKTWTLTKAGIQFYEKEVACLRKSKRSMTRSRKPE